MKQQDKTLLVIVTGLAALSLLFALPILLYIGVAIGLVSILSDTIANYIIWGWNKIAAVVGYINSRILLTVVYFVLLVPISFLSRLFNKGSIIRKRQKGSYFDTRNHTYTANDMRDMW